MTAKQKIFYGFSILFIGAIGLEPVGAFFDRYSFTAQFCVIAEESLEMAGTIFIIAGLLEHLQNLRRNRL